MEITKNPNEQFGVSLDFSADLGAGGSIASITSVTAVNRWTGADASALVIASSPAPAISGTGVALTVKGGVAGQTYAIVIAIVSAIGEGYQGEITLAVVGLATGYATVDACASAFPSFVRNGPKGPSDLLIQTFIDDEAAEIDAILQRRFQEAYQAVGFTAWITALVASSPDVADLLEKINRHGACGEMGNVFAAAGVDLFRRMAAEYEQKATLFLNRLNARDEHGKPLAQGGDYDYLFDSQAKVETPRAQLDGFVPSHPAFKKWDIRED